MRQRSNKRRWWNKPINKKYTSRYYVLIAAMAIAVLVEILFSPVARIWFGLLILGPVLVAIYLQLREARREQ